MSPTRVCVLTILVLAFVCAAALAGGGPENVLVVVNADSWASKAIANEFVRLRHIPPNNVVYISLGEVGDYSTVGVDYFRDSILKPIFETIKQRRLSGQIDYVVYSTDMPNAVDFTADVGGEKLRPPFSTLTASATGLTCLYRRTMSKVCSPELGGYLALNANHYARRPMRADQLGKENQQLLARCRVFMEDGDFVRAEALMLDLLKRRPRSIMLLHGHAIILTRMDRHADAVKELNKAVNEGFVEADQLVGDANLKPLADREDFKQLIERMKELAGKPGVPKPTQALVKTEPSLAFRSTLTWDASGQLVEAGRANPLRGETYLISTLLAWTSGRGNSVREAIDCLRRSATADGTRPDGTIYYVLNSDVRSRTRMGEFPSALALLKELGVKAEVFKTEGAGFPRGEKIAGIMAGSSDFSFEPSGSALQPGAIAEHLTSFGGNLNEGCGQTGMTDWLRAGASGTSGTVTEPWAIAEKFPLAYIQVHYAKGYSLGEAFYQSVCGPYQLLIMGDPLTKPWARIPKVQLRGLADGDKVKGKVTIYPTVADNKATPVGEWELFVDGKRQTTTLAGEELTLDTTQLPDGYHEVRVVAVTSDDTRTQGQARLTVICDNHGKSGTATLMSGATMRYGYPVKVQVRAAGAKAIVLAHNGRALATVRDSSGTLSVDSRVLGTGPVTLQVVAMMQEKPSADSMYFFQPIEVTIDPPAPLPGLDIPEAKLAAGGELFGLLPTAKTVAGNVRADWLKKLQAKPGQELRLGGYLTVTAEDMYQFQVRSDGPCELVLDKQTLVPAGTGKGWQFYPVSLKPGVHYLSVRFTTGKNLVMEVRFGGKGTQSLGEKNFRHVMN